MKLSDVLTTPWAIVPETLMEIVRLYDGYLKGPKLSLDGFDDPKKTDYEMENGAAIIDITGPLAKKTGLFERILFGSQSMYQIKNIISDAMNDPSVKGIILNIDSPGGTVDGTPELADYIYSLRGKKPIVAYSDGRMASAAYWIGAAADAVYISGGTVQVGSIGVILSHAEYSEMDRMSGIKVTEIFAGKYKAAGSGNKPLDDESKNYLQERVDQIYAEFVRTVAKFRGVSEKVVLANMADGRIFMGKNAIDAGLVDGIATLDSLIDKLSGGGTGEGARSVFAQPKITTEEDQMQITAELIAAEHKEVFEAIKELGRAEAIKDVDAEKIAASAAAGERERIRSIFAQKEVGFEKIIEEMMFDGKTTEEQAQARLWQAEKELRKAKAAALESDAEKPVPDARTPEGEPKGKKDFLALVDECMEISKCSRGEAITAMAQAHPELHAAYIASINKKGE